MNLRVAGLVLLPLLAFAQTPAIDNERVTVWNLTWEKGHPGFSVPGEFDAITVYLNGGTFQTASGKTVTHRTGEAIFRPRGDRQIETWLGGDTTGGDTPPHTVEIELKNHPSPAPLPNPGGYPAPFPRPGAHQLFENARVTIWDTTWEPGVMTPMHFHEKDVVISYLKGGQVTSFTAGGESSVGSNRTGAVKFNPRNRAHREKLTGGEQHAIIVELR